jgi:hypothetical protein
MPLNYICSLPTHKVLFRNVSNHYKVMQCHNIQLTPWSRVLYEHLITPQLDQKFTAFYATEISFHCAKEPTADPVQSSSRHLNRLCQNAARHKTNHQAVYTSYSTQDKSSCSVYFISTKQIIMQCTLHTQHETNHHAVYTSYSAPNKSPCSVYFINTKQIIMQCILHTQHKTNHRAVYNLYSVQNKSSCSLYFILSTKK